MGPNDIVDALTNINHLGVSVSVTFDFRDIDTVSASTLSHLIILHRNLRPLGGRIVVQNVTPFVVEIFRATHLDSVFEIHPQNEGPRNRNGSRPVGSPGEPIY